MSSAYDFEALSITGKKVALSVILVGVSFGVLLLIRGVLGRGEE